MTVITDDILDPVGQITCVLKEFLGFGIDIAVYFCGEADF